MAQNQKPTVLITGSEGLIGSHLVRSLHEDYTVVGFDIAGSSQQPEREDYVSCDLTKDESVREALETTRRRHGNHLDSVIHLAAYYDFSGKESPLYQDLTVEGTRRLLRGLQNFEVDQFIFSSTLLVMKPAEEDELIREDSPKEPEWRYPQSKLRAERVIEQERGEIPAVILRIAGVYDDDCHSIPIAQQISRIYEKNLESYVFPGDPSKGQPFIHMEDLVNCLLQVVKQRRKLDDPQEVFLIAEPDVLSYEELQERLGELIHGEEWPAIRIPKPVAKAGAWAKDKLAGDEDDGSFIKPWMIDLADQHYPVAITKAQQKLGWQPKRRLRDALPKMVAALKKDPRRWYEVNKLPAPEEVRA